MPSTQTRRDWAYGLFLISREITPENQAVLANELNVLVTRYISTPHLIEQFMQNIDYGLATSVFERKGEVFGLKTKHSNKLLSDIVAKLLLDDTLTFKSSYFSEDEAWDFLVILYVTLSAFERFVKEITNNKRIYAKDLLSLRLYTYQLTADQSNVDVLRDELFNAIGHHLSSSERYLNTILEFRNTISYGLVMEDGYQMVDFYTKSDARRLSWFEGADELNALSVLEMLGITPDEWDAFVVFIGYYLLTFARYRNEVS